MPRQTTCATRCLACRKSGAASPSTRTSEVSTCVVVPRGSFQNKKTHPLTPKGAAPASHVQRNGRFLAPPFRSGESRKLSPEGAARNDGSLGLTFIVTRSRHYILRSSIVRTRWLPRLQGPATQGALFHQREKNRNQN